ncbi:hypothetical protein ACU4GD_41840 [Cupriavidus basilensis]
MGAQGGNGVMFAPDGTVLGYYNATAVSYGLQAGAQTFSLAMFFMNDKALSDLNDSDGMSVGGRAERCRGGRGRCKIHDQPKPDIGRLRLPSMGSRD